MSISERQLIESLYEEGRFDPLRTSDVRETSLSGRGEYRQPDAWLSLNWSDRSFPFFLEVKPSTSSRTIGQAVDQLSEMGKVFSYANPDARPLLMVPFLSSALVGMLEDTGVSAIDGSGNFFLQTPELLAIRLDKPKRFRDDRGIKNPYRGDSSLVGRALLHRNQTFSSNSSLLRVIRELGGELVPSTVSKALATMEEDLIVDRSDGVRLLQPALLLDQLSENYERPDPKDKYKARIEGGQDQVATLLDEAFGPSGWMWSGESSLAKYTTTTPPPRYRVYAKSSPKNRSAVQDLEDKRFYNCEITIPSKTYVFFARTGSWASELETYLDLSIMDKREQELAGVLRERILGRFQ